MIHPRTKFLSCLAALLCAASVTSACSSEGQVGPAPEGTGAAESPTTVMVLGDSITQGSSGDWTWRYFAARGLEEDGADVDFVGPRRGPWNFVLGDVDTPGEYADGNFDSDHAATVGDSFHTPSTDHEALLDEYSPDVLVVMLGANDFVYWKQSAKATTARAASWLTKIRAAHPDLTVVFSEVPLPTSSAARAFNAELPRLVRQLSTPEQPVVLATVADGYRIAKAPRKPHDPRTPDATGDSWDGLHPNTRGAQKIALGVENALAQVGIGTEHSQDSLEPWPNGPTVVPVLKLEPGDGTVKAQYLLPAGTTTADVWVRRGKDGAPRRVARDEASGWSLPNLEPCTTYSVWVRARKGWLAADEKYASDKARVRTDAAGAPHLGTTESGC